MEFLDELESRPRFVLQSKQQLSHPSSDSDQQLHSTSFISSLHKPSLIISLSFSILIFFVAFFYFNDMEPLKSLLLWLAISLLLGPFAPPSITAGDIRVGVGPTLKEIPIQEVVSVETREKFRKSTRKSPPQVNPPEAALRSADGFVEKLISDPKVTTNKASKDNGEETIFVGERDWTDVDEDLLRKFMAKNPVGKPGRWEAIAEGFKGKHNVESVIQRAKEMGERRKVSDQDSYQKFLKDRKPVDQRAVDEVNGVTNQDLDEGKKDGGGWTAAEDLALLNALKTFPKEVAMRWEKIAAALPGRTKAACMKRVTHLKKDFRSSKAGQPS